ncbi:thioesterase II family protein [Rhizobium skierniewicense]|uniref:thioesterase II family protein n=1 Tax=Rhizobium skierniewicense TaxID=984260 RepID=UPI001574BDD2|nr:alpha/beta fold hydrolase [Rhizobium skierniewicense]NTF35006.1 thioesterase [Rhizobium skierniewicense]
MNTVHPEKDEEGVWITPMPSADRALVRLFCLPYAGGNAALYRDWPKWLGPKVDVCPLHLPGRGRRFREKPLYRVSDIADQAAEALLQHLDRPYALFGHSMGASVAFEIARRLRRHGAPEPGCLFVSGRSAPHLPKEGDNIHALPDDAFIDAVMRLNGSPPEVLKHPDLIDLILPTLRADFEAVETYHLTPEPPLTCPIVALGGREDPDLPATSIEAWRVHSTGTFRHESFPGDHFFIRAQDERFFTILRSELSSLMRKGQ